MTFLPRGSSETFIDLDGGRVRVLGSIPPQSAGAAPSAGAGQGAGPPILLIHGGGMDNSAISWFNVFTDLAGEGRLLAVDLPGFGRTSGIEPVGGADALADFVARAAQALGVTRAVVMGVSMGGDVALNLALRRPDLVGALVLIAPGGLVPVFRNRPAQLAAWLMAQLPGALLEPVIRRVSKHVEAALAAMVKDPGTLPPEVVEEFVREAQRPRAGMAYARYNQASLGPWGMRNNLLPQAARIGVPALLFHGQDDPLVDPAGSRRASQLMPAARLVLVPGCGHWAHLEAPGRFNREVRAFLAAYRQAG